MALLFTDDDETVQKINIDDLYEKNQQRDLKQIGIFNKILNRIHKRINVMNIISFSMFPNIFLENLFIIKENVYLI